MLYLLCSVPFISALMWIDYELTVLYTQIYDEDWQHMKKIIAALLVLTIIVGTSACSVKNPENEMPSHSSETSTSPY